jgi:hypothetical protein
VKGEALAKTQQYLINSAVRKVVANRIKKLRQSEYYEELYRHDKSGVRTEGDKRKAFIEKGDWLKQSPYDHFHTVGIYGYFETKLGGCSSCA